eukprot:1783929-Pleurochrysis_carterae.AAC.1
MERSNQFAYLNAAISQGAFASSLTVHDGTPRTLAKRQITTRSAFCTTNVRCDFDCNFLSSLSLHLPWLLSYAGVAAGVQTHERARARSRQRPTRADAARVA